MYALGAGDLFNVNGHSEYVETIIGKLIIFCLEIIFLALPCMSLVGLLLPD